MKTENRLIALKIFAKRAMEQYLNIEDSCFDMDIDYKFEIGDTRVVPSGKTRNKSVLGFCSFRQQLIKIEQVHAENCDIAEVKDTILHEIAHARAYHLHRDNGHGKMWRKECLVVGAIPKAKAKVTNETMKEHLLSQHKWAIVLIDCGHVELSSWCKRKLVRLHQRFVKGDRSTIGKLFHVSMSTWNSGDKQKIIAEAWSNRIQESK